VWEIMGGGGWGLDARESDIPGGPMANQLGATERAGGPYAPSEAPFERITSRYHSAESFSVRTCVW
jgi:hypothetical protein